MFGPFGRFNLKFYGLYHNGGSNNPDNLLFALRGVGLSVPIGCQSSVIRT